MGNKLFRDKSVEDQTNTLASFMPGGRPFLAARLTSTNLRKLLLGIAYEAYRAENTLNEITQEHDISSTTLLIEEWERALGIPDHCFTNTGTLTERRRNVIAKLSMSIQTEQDFIDLAALFGFIVQIEKGSDRGIFPFTNKFPIYFFDYAASARFTQITYIYTVNLPNIFPLDFPILFGDNVFRVVECLFRELSPRNVKLIFEYKLPDEGAIITENLRNYFYLQDGSGFIVLE